MEYRSIAELNDRVVDWIGVLPRDLDLIVGIPRSGMLPANLLALHLHLPFTDVEGLCSGRIMASGQRGVPYPDPERPLNVLVVDDSVCSGISMDRVRATVTNAGLPHRIRYGAVFVTPEAVREGKVELFAEAVPMPRAFEWNILHTRQLDRFCIDFDTVILGGPADTGADSTVGDNAFRAYVEPWFLPRHRVGWLVTRQPDTRREEALAWLARQGVECEELIMPMGPRDLRSPVAFKARIYRETGAELFIEGDPDHASAIAEQTGKPVFCFATRAMIYPGDFPRYRHIPVRAPHRIELAFKWLVRLPLRVVNRLYRRFAREPDCATTVDPKRPAN
ncbi:hypothetical protein [Halofilum ochraceum]|uniref:hypothetical protein n=1 Tax=Halofilum ochraceum TaxID=1611323 RepID=UPI0008310B4D|nr:hypothetical protein [Halofilum ochraceum]